MILLILNDDHPQELISPSDDSYEVQRRAEGVLYVLLQVGALRLLAAHVQLTCVQYVCLCVQRACFTVLMHGILRQIAHNDILSFYPSQLLEDDSEAVIVAASGVLTLLQHTETHTSTHKAHTTPHSCWRMIPRRSSSRPPLRSPPSPTMRAS